MTDNETKWRRQPEERPGQIMDAALEVFSDKGFVPATMDEIAAAAGITKGTVYLYFPSKEDLFVSMVRAQFSQVFDLLPRISFNLSANLEDMARELGRELLNVLMTPRIAKLIPLILAEIHHLPSLRKLYQEEILPKANIQLAKLLELGMSFGILRQTDPIIAARCLLGTEVPP